ncbi:Hypothetical protein NTJ_14652 [Nesidiocoris tenuis]|uniref:Uncharacterized protein n=1 Tax=Nesidiocoris tenuis TaxID=355587 RepID=A0ABN7BDW3_9HEMI|nr:Hypothetical protein NTJ_14652 [Nesidiocoris tenuis]
MMLWNVCKASSTDDHRSSIMTLQASSSRTLSSEAWCLYESLLKGPAAPSSTSLLQLFQQALANLDH